MKLITLIICLLPVLCFAEICPTCGQEILPVITNEIQVKKDLDNRTTEWSETIKTDGVVTQKRVNTYTYYLSSGAVKLIEQKVYDGKNKLIKHKKITHYEGGKQPILETVEVPK